MDDIAHLTKTDTTALRREADHFIVKPGQQSTEFVKRRSAPP